MAKIWRTFQNKLAKLLEFSLGEKKKKNPIFLFRKRTLLIYGGKWDFFLYVQLCDGENLANFSKKKKKN
jgi:hypothetical protein